MAGDIPNRSHSDASEASPFRRHLGFGSLTAMGVAAIIGGGIFVLTGTAAANYAGPGVTLSFILAGFASLFAALCYAELASMMPAAGSAYTYTLATMGKGVAWSVGWTLVLEYLFATSTVAVGWSGYLNSLLGQMGLTWPSAWVHAPFDFSPQSGWSASGAVVNLPAAVIVLALTGVLAAGIRGSSFTWTMLTVLKVTVVLLVVGCGALHVNPANWHPFVPPNQGHFGAYGASGVVRAAGVVFYAYIGFDMVSTSGAEAIDPTRDIPRSILSSLAICTALYVCMALVVTGLVPYRALDVPNPIFVAIAGAPALSWLAVVVNVGALLGLASAMIVTLYGQTRIFYQMSRDGFLPAFLGRVSRRFQTPVQSTWLVGILAALIAAFLPVDVLGQLVSIGTLFAFAIVCLGVLVLRRTAAELPRKFRTPALWLVGPLGAALCFGIMLSMPASTWARLTAWLAVGALLYPFVRRRVAVDPRT
jgi:basic amino acid/polyamine antiporter, APA family